MDILEELEYYCQEQHVVGALMLTGEWGCGKTYLINNELKNALKDTHVILRVSLFGVDSIEEVRDEVKKCWLYEFIASKEKISWDAEKMKKVGGTIKSTAERTLELLPDSLKNVTNSVLSLNPFDFVKIKPQMGDKRVALIFDDLERATIPINDLLGCINDYCENLGINTIVVANEKRVEKNGADNISYDEIKEKIVQRTISYTPNYSAVVSNIIGGMVNDNNMNEETYGTFLENNKEKISAIFSGPTVTEDVSPAGLANYEKTGKEYENEKRNNEELVKKRPHNIRSLKYALQEFKRIYCLLEDNEIAGKERWLFSYISYVLSFRAGLIPESESYGTLLSDNVVSILYPGFYDDRYITRGIKQWVRYGEWIQDVLNAELKYILERDKAITPEEKVSRCRLLDLEETDVTDGYPIYLRKAYDGELELDAYVNLIYSSCWGRKYNIQLPNIEWEKVCEGIHKHIDKLLLSGEDQSHDIMIISDTNEKYFIQEELAAYKIIDDFRNANTLMFEKNKSLYMRLIQTEPTNALIQLQSKRFDRFDADMAEATAREFGKIQNAERSNFVGAFKRMWQVNISSPDYKIELSRDGFDTLENRIQRLLQKFMDESLTISAVHARRFLEEIENLIKEQDAKEN